MSLWGPTYQSKSPNEKILFRTHEELDIFFRDWKLRELLETEEKRNFVKNLLLHYLKDNDYGVTVLEIEEHVLPQLRKHSHDNPLSESDFSHLKEIFLNL